MPVLVKICGITCLEDAMVAVEAGADYLGFVFAPSPRQVTPRQAAEIIGHLPDTVKKVGVVVDEDLAEILDTCPLDIVQIHGHRPVALPSETKTDRPSTRTPEHPNTQVPEFWRALRVRTRQDLLPMWERNPDISAFVLDAHVDGLEGGTGKTCDWDLAAEAVGRGRRVVLAGGLSPENVCDAVRRVQPWAVDVSTGVEAGLGRKDPDRVRRFIKAAKNVDRRYPSPSTRWVQRLVERGCRTDSQDQHEE